LRNELIKKFGAARKLYPHTKNVVYFNTASHGPFSTQVRNRILANLDQRVQSEKDDSHKAFATADQLRADYAGLIGAPKRSVGIGMNTSFGLSLAAFGLPLQKGDEVILSEVEFPALIYTWKAAAEMRGLKIKIVKSRNRCFDADALEKHIGRRTRVLAVSYVQFFNGFKNDLMRLGEICRRHNLLFVVDGIQGTGAESVNVRKAGIDVFSAGCQKWLLSPEGGGFFYLSDRVREKIQPPFMSWMGADWKERFTDLFHHDKPLFASARRFELGYYAPLNLLGMKASVGLFQDIGIRNIQKHNHALIDRLVAYIKGSNYYRVTSALEPTNRSSIVTFTCSSVTRLHRHLLDRKFILVVREGSIRVSCHLFNNEADVDKLIDCLDRFAS